MVVGIHTSARHCSFDSIVGISDIIIRQILNSGVPIFFAISGYFLSKKDLSTKDNRLSFWKHQIPKVYIPTLIWGIPWLLLSLYLGGNPFIQFGLWLCCGLAVFYYIAVTIQNYLLLPIYQQITSPRRRILISLVISTATIMLITWLRVIKGVNLPLIVYAGFFPLWMIFFSLGVELANYKKDYKVYVLIVLVFLILAMQVVESYYLERFGGPGYGIKLSSFLFSILTILILFSDRTQKLWCSNSVIARLFVRIGEMSFAIYLTHYLIANLIVTRLPIYHLWAIDWSLTLLFSIILVVLLQKLLPESWHKYIGV